MTITWPTASFLPHEHVVQGLGLVDRAREAVEDEPLVAVRCVDPVRDDANHDFIRNELALVHDRLGLLPDFGAWRDGGAQHVARR